MIKIYGGSVRAFSSTLEYKENETAHIKAKPWIFWQRFSLDEIFHKKIKVSKRDSFYIHFRASPTHNQKRLQKGKHFKLKFL